MQDYQTKIENLKKKMTLYAEQDIVVAFSGGADSGLLSDVGFRGPDAGDALVGLGAILVGEHDPLEFASPGHVGFSENIRGVELHGARSELATLSDVLVAALLQDELGDGSFPRCETECFQALPLSGHCGALAVFPQEGAQLRHSEAKGRGLLVHDSSLPRWESPPASHPSIQMVPGLLREETFIICLYIE